MELHELEELLELEKKLYQKLSTVLDQTRQLSDAVDRHDQASVRMVLDMRQKSVLELQELQAYLSLKRCDLSGGDVQRFDRILAGTASGPGEAPAAEQAASNLRLTHRLLELDRAVNRRLCGSRSCYGPGPALAEQP